jgi:hypothetical protein
MSIMSSTRISRHVNAPRAIVYHALLDARGRDVDGADRHDQPRVCVRRPRGRALDAIALGRNAESSISSSLERSDQGIVLVTRCASPNSNQAKVRLHQAACR